MIIAATDGSSLSNPGPAGWAWVIDDDRWAAGGWKEATNNQAELMAVLDLLNQTEPVQDEPLLIQCDSQYVINTISKWMAGWKRKGWKKADGKPVLNLDLVKQLDQAIQGRKVDFEWVKGHTGHPLNERADELARAVATAYQEGTVPETGPGFSVEMICSKSELIRPKSATTQSEPASFGTEAKNVEGVSPSEMALSEASVVDQVKESKPELPSPVEIQTRLQQLMEALSVPSREKARELITPDYSEVDSAGKPHSRNKTLAMLGAGRPVMRMPDQVTVEAIESLVPGLVLVRAQLVWAGRTGIQTTIWAKTDGKTSDDGPTQFGEQWNCRFRQVTMSN